MTFQTFTPLQYLQIDIASNYGLDKETWNTRLEWFRENEHQLADLAVEAENPALYAAGLMAYDLAKANKPVHYMISLDATASGAQIMAATVGCRKSAELCNVVDTGNREDFYTRIHEGVLARCPDANDITRAQSKQAGMTHLYNSKAEPRKAYGADSPPYKHSIRPLLKMLLVWNSLTKPSTVCAILKPQNITGYCLTTFMQATKSKTFSTTMLSSWVSKKLLLSNLNSPMIKIVPWEPM